MAIDQDFSVFNKYDNEQHFKLQKFQNSNQKLEDSELRKLIGYQMVLEDHVYWMNKPDFYSAIRDFTKNLIDCEDFKYRFCMVSVKSINDLRTIKNNITLIEGFSPNPESCQFYGEMRSIYRDFENEFSTDEELKIYVQEIYKDL